MAAERYALIKDGKVINIIMWDAEANPDFKPPEGGQPVLLGEEQVEIDFDFDGKEFADNRPLPPEPDLGVTKEFYIATIDAEFKSQQLSMFVDSAKREQLRTAALATVQEIRDAPTLMEVASISQRGVVQLQTLAKGDSA